MSVSTISRGERETDPAADVLSALGGQSTLCAVNISHSLQANFSQTVHSHKEYARRESVRLCQKEHAKRTEEEERGSEETVKHERKTSEEKIEKRETRPSTGRGKREDFAWFT